jgi:hypothetical protein
MPTKKKPMGTVYEPPRPPRGAAFRALQVHPQVPEDDAPAAVPTAEERAERDVQLARACHRASAERLMASIEAQLDNIRAAADLAGESSVHWPALRDRLQVALRELDVALGRIEADGQLTGWDDSEGLGSREVSPRGPGRDAPRPPEPWCFPSEN